MDEKRRCDYLYVRHTKVSASSPDVPSKLYKVGVPAGGCSCITCCSLAGQTLTLGGETLRD